MRSIKILLRNRPNIGRMHATSCNTMQPHLQEKKQCQQAQVCAIDAAYALKLARQCLLDGKVIALPTDTVYGLACDANNEQAIQRMYDIKGRDEHKPVAICVKDIAALRCYGDASHLSDELLGRLLPGPLTIVIERTPRLSNRFLNPSTSKIGIRIPAFKFISDLCSIWDEQPLALTSANRSSEPSSLQVSEFQTLWSQLGVVIDAGQIGKTEDQRLASTVIDLTTPARYVVVRAGIALKQTLKVLHEYGYKAKKI